LICSFFIRDICVICGSSYLPGNRIIAHQSIPTTSLTLCVALRLPGFASHIISSANIRFYPFHPCSTSTNKLDNNMILPLVPAAHRLASKRCYPFCFPLRLRASARDHFFNQKSSASDIFNSDVRLTRLRFGVLRLGGAFFLNPRCPISCCRNEKESGARAPHSISPRLVVIRLIRAIRGL